MSAPSLRVFSSLAALAVGLACTSELPSGPTDSSPGDGLTIVPSAAVIQQGGVVQLEARLQPVDESGDEIKGFAISWTSSNETIATVSPNGMVKGLDEGRAVIKAEVRGLSRNATVQVLRRSGKPPALQ